MIPFDNSAGDQKTPLLGNTNNVSSVYDHEYPQPATAPNYEEPQPVPISYQQSHYQPPEEPTVSVQPGVRYDPLNPSGHRRPEGEPSYHHSAPPNVTVQNQSTTKTQVRSVIWRPAGTDGIMVCDWCQGRCSRSESQLKSVSTEDPDNVVICLAIILGAVAVLIGLAIGLIGGVFVIFIFIPRFRRCLVAPDGPTYCLCPGCAKRFDEVRAQQIRKRRVSLGVSLIISTLVMLAAVGGLVVFLYYILPDLNDDDN